MIQIPKSSNIAHLRIDSYLLISVEANKDRVRALILVNIGVKVTGTYSFIFQNVKEFKEFITNITGFENNSFILLNTKHIIYGQLFSICVKNNIQHFKII